MTAPAKDLEFPRRPEKYENVVEAAIKRMEEDTHVIRGLRQQNARLKEELLNAQLEASLEIAKAKFGQAQAFLRITELEQRIAAAERESDRLNNFVTGYCVQRDEFEQVRASVSGLLARETI